MEGEIHAMFEKAENETNQQIQTKRSMAKHKDDRWMFEQSESSEAELADKQLGETISKYKQEQKKIAKEYKNGVFEDVTAEPEQGPAKLTTQDLAFPESKTSQTSHPNESPRASEN